MNASSGPHPNTELLDTMVGLLGDLAADLVFVSKPTIGKSEHTLIRCHDIQQAGPNDPTTDRRLGTTVVTESRLF